mgnify:CR=1 FL=1
MEEIKKFWNSLDGVFIVRKRELFLGGALLNALPGIALQLVLIPAVMVLLDRTKLVRFTKPDPACRQAG